MVGMRHGELQLFKQALQILLNALLEQKTDLIMQTVLSAHELFGRSIVAFRFFHPLSCGLSHTESCPVS